MSELSVLLTDLTFPEGPRWRDGRLFFSDFYSHQVLSVDMEGRHETVATVSGQPSGLGWTPEGALLIVSMKDRSLLKLEGGRLEVFADLSHLAPSLCNDMVVDTEGRAYVGNFGFDRRAEEEPCTTCVILVQPNGESTVADDDLFFPNGSAITPDQSTLIVAETWRRRLTAWDIGDQGSLHNRRIFADLGDNVPDGICLDGEGAVWVADPRNNQALRVHEGGKVSQRVDCDRGVYACALGGDDRRTLLLCTNTGSGPEAAEICAGRIEFTRVEVPGAGLP